MLNEVDADGFQMVKPRKKRKRAESAMARRGSSAPRERKQKKKETEIANFYGYLPLPPMPPIIRLSLTTATCSHQIREQKRAQLLDLRKKFEEDKKKVAELKEGRKFKPF
jgi:ribosomal RNA-processing protein 7